MRAMQRQPDKRRIVPKAGRVTERAPTLPEQVLHDAHFLITAARWAQLPTEGMPEIAFAGRSNAGKSSAINALTRRARLAFASKTPGRTRHINFFRLRSGALLADLPGYGYAEVPGSVRRDWQQFLARYLAERASLVGLVMVMDARHPITELDQQTLDWMLPARFPVHILLAKSDKLSRPEQSRTLKQVSYALEKNHAGKDLSVQLFSAVKREGIEEACAVIASWLDGAKKKGPGVKGSDTGPKNALRSVR